MMNVLAFGLVLTSLVTAGFFTSKPEQQDVIVKQGHRVVVVEYENDAERTKVLISPHDTLVSSQLDEGKKRVVTNGGEENLSEKMAGVKKKADDVSSSVLHDAGDKTHHLLSPKEMVCDAYGTCRETLAGVIGKTKDKASEVKEETEEKISDAAHKTSDKLHKAKEGLKEVSETISAKTREVREGVKEELSRKAKEAEQRTEDTSQRAKEKVSEVTHKASDKVQEARESLSEASREVMDKVSHKAREMKEGAKEQLSEKAKEADESSKTITRKGEKEFSEILRRAREVCTDVFEYTVPRGQLNLFASVLNLMGFSAAYGMCVWITFASSYVLARVLPRPQFAIVQSKIYPVYFKAMASSLGLALLGHLMNPGETAAKLQAINLAASLGMVMVNLLHFEPLATKAMLERMKKEKEESSARQEQDRDSLAETAGRVSSGAKKVVRETPEEVAAAAAAKSDIIKLRADLRRLNSYSSALNVLTLISLSWYLVHLGQRLQC